MKKRLIQGVCVIGFFAIMIFALWVSFQYTYRYKKEVCDRAVSPDGRYELILQQIGEPDWPFGSVSGRLLLTEDGVEISETDFQLANDGGNIHSDCWKVSWQTDCAEVVLSGEEQADRQIWLFFDGRVEMPQPTEAVQTPQQREPELVKLNISVIENRVDEWAFDISLEEFINSFNSFYLYDRQKDYLLPREQWRVLAREKGVHSNYAALLYEFTVDARVWSQPTISAYIPSTGEYLLGATVNFDDHGYSESFYKEYEMLCYYTLKVFFPDMPKDEIISLYTTINSLGGENIIMDSDGYRNGVVPPVLYYADGIGVYPYFARGEWEHFCIIPITEEMLRDYARKGVEVYEIP